MKGFVPVAAALCLLAANTSSETLTLRLLPTPSNSEQARLFKRLGDFGKPTLVKFPAGMGLDDLIRQRCGFVNDVIRAWVLEGQPQLSAQSAEERQILFPPCPFWSFDVPLSVDRSMDLPRLAGIFVGMTGPKTTQQIVERNAAAFDSKDRLKGTDSVLRLPFVTKPFSLVLKASAGTPAQVANRIAHEFPKLFQAELLDNYLNGTASSIGLYTAVPASATRNCAGRSGKWPFDSDRIAIALQVNEGLRDPDGQYMPATILVADTGLREVDSAGLPLRRNAGEFGPGAIANRDDDGNGYVDDIVGANMSRRVGYPEPIGPYLEADHGTQVVSQLFGRWMTERLRTHLRERIRISLANIVHNDVFGIESDGAPRVHVHVPLSAIEGAFVYAESMHPRPVLNVSFKSDTTLPALEVILKGAPFLAVVAAGNDGENIDRVGKQKYPPEWRRTYRDTMITVAAHDGTGALASFSNRGADVVDLAAPGCMLPAVGFGKDQIYGSGTSLATPLVSLTAALLYSEGVMRPADIRNRILAATDFDPVLKDVYSSGRLNIEKSIRIYQDAFVPRTSDGSIGEPQFGRLQVGEDLRICDDVVPLRDVVKLVPIYRSGDQPMLLLRKSGKTVVQTFCSAAPDVRLTFTPEGLDTARSIGLDEVADLVPALR